MLHGYEIRRRFAWCRSALACATVLLGWTGGVGGETAPAPKAPSPLPARLGLMEAVRNTLERDPNIQLQERQVDVAQGILENAAGQFDPTFDTALSQGWTHTLVPSNGRIGTSPRADLVTLVEDVTSYRLGLSKQLRSGPTIAPSLELTRLADNQDRQRAANMARVTFAFKVPLLRGAGAKAVAAGERAAKVQREAATLDLQYTIASRLFNTVNAYWNCLAAERDVQVLRESEANAWRLTNHLDQLIQAKEFPAAELQQALADYAEKSAARIAAEQQLFAARQNLGLALGLRADQLSTAPLPAEDFPDLPEPTARPPTADASLVERSLARRADYQSALKGQVASETLLIAARNGVKPQLDLDLEAGYTGVEDGSQFRHYFGSLDPWLAPGPNLLASLRLGLPIGNHAARGLLLQRDAEYQQSLIRTRDLARTISSGIQVAVNDLTRAIEELRKLRQSVKMYERAVTNESLKLKLGSSTVLDQITIADRLAGTWLRQTAARARYAAALVRLRYETGLLVPLEATQSVTLTREDLVTIPELTVAPVPPQSP